MRYLKWVRKSKNDLIIGNDTIKQKELIKHLNFVLADLLTSMINW